MADNINLASAKDGEINTRPVTEVTRQNPKDGSWEGIIKYYDRDTGEMVPKVRVKVRSISNIIGKMQ